MKFTLKAVNAEQAFEHLSQIVKTFFTAPSKLAEVIVSFADVEAEAVVEAPVVEVPVVEVPVVEAPAVEAPVELTPAETASVGGGITIGNFI